MLFAIRIITKILAVVGIGFFIYWLIARRKAAKAAEPTPPATT